MDANLGDLEQQSRAPAICSSGPDLSEGNETQFRGAKAPVSSLVYLLSRYPAVSHTFFLNEVLELRRLGFTIETASINQPDRSRSSMGATEEEETDRTFYVKSIGVIRATALAAKTLVLRPRTFCRGFAAALRLGRWDVIATLYALFYFVEALILGNWMRVHRHRHLHIHFCGPVATVGMLSSIAWGFSYSLTVHGPDEFYDVEKFYLREKIERAKFIVCVSDFSRGQLMRVADPAHWDKMHVVRLGVDPRVFHPIQHDRDPAGLQEILCVGRLVASKGQLILLRACVSLLSQGCSIRLRLVGAGPDREYLEAFAKRMKIPAIFEGAKSHDEIRQLLGSADIFVLASFAEGVPVALMEAMAMEIPCVSTFIAGIPELIRDGFEGLLVPASSVEALASAVRLLLDDPPLRRGLGVAGCKRVRELYGLPQNVYALSRVFYQYAPYGN